METVMVNFVLKIYQYHTIPRALIFFDLYVFMANNSKPRLKIQNTNNSQIGVFYLS